MDERDWLAGRFEEHRSRLRAVAYRMLGAPAGDLGLVALDGAAGGSLHAISAGQRVFTCTLAAFVHAVHGSGQQRAAIGGA